jgi:hypothetical protein
MVKNDASRIQVRLASMMLQRRSNQLSVRELFRREV